MDYTIMATEFIDKLRNEQFEECIPLFTDKMKTALPADKLKAAWESTIAGVGDYIGVEKTETEQKDGTEIVRVYIAFSVQGVIVQLPYDKNRKISGLWFNYYQSGQSESPDLPEGLTETDIIVGEGELSLPGKLTKLVDKKSEYAVVLVHGSGPQDI